MEKDLRVVDMDDCPKTDNPIIKDDCRGCEFYVGFEMWKGMPCINCSYYSKSNDD